MLRIKNIKMELYEDEKLLLQKVCKILKVNTKDINRFEISKKGLDSRKKSNICYVYNVDVHINEEYLYVDNKTVFIMEDYKYDLPTVTNNKNRPVIIGNGPAGMLAGLILAEANLKPIIIEQGSDVDNRIKDIEEFWSGGKLNTSSNVQFGAGGAGTFSDGKLTTGVSDDRKIKLLDSLIAAGAPKEIKYLTKAHIGTDILIEVVRNINKKIIDLGGEIYFDTKFIDFELNEDKISSIKVINNNEERNIDVDYLVLALGHSARDTFELLYDKKVSMQSKPFSVGVRIEHLQEEINECQYGDLKDQLNSADYKLSTHLDNQRGVYTFCMCPGGLVVASSSEENRVVTNGMSYYSRAEVNANSALLVSITPKDYDFDNNPLSGIEFQRKLESDAFILGGSDYKAPAQRVGDFLNNTSTTSFGSVTPSYKPGVKPCNLNDMLPEFISISLKEAIIDLGNKIPAFKNEDAVLTAIESRSSSPITIQRDEHLISSVKGLYPSGEGAGYAGGIVSAAIDGMKVAESIINHIKEQS